MQTKVCLSCEQTLPVSAFSRLARAKDGLKPSCKTCANRKQRERYAQNAASRLKSNTKYRLANKDEINRRRREKYASDTAYREEVKQKNRAAFALNRQARLAANRAYRRVNRPAVIAAAAARKAKIRTATPAWLTAEQRAQIVATYAHARDCYVCTGERYDVDHIVPIMGDGVCGLHVPWNLQVLPAHVNRAKWNHYDGT